MFLIGDYRAPSPQVKEKEKPKKGSWLVEIRDVKTRQSLLVEHDEPIDAYVFPDPETMPRMRRGASLWADGERHAEGVLVGELDGESWVCFVELKGSLEHLAPWGASTTIDSRTVPMTSRCGQRRSIGSWDSSWRSAGTRCRRPTERSCWKTRRCRCARSSSR